jgi:hypothetical protein
MHRTIPLIFEFRCGHPTDPGNVYLASDGKPRCWTCKRVAKQESRDRCKAARESMNGRSGEIMAAIKKQRPKLTRSQHPD